MDFLQTKPFSKLLFTLIFCHTSSFFFLFSQPSSFLVDGHPLQEDYNSSNDSGRIINGRPAHPDAYPFIVQIRLNDGHMCGGK